MICRLKTVLTEDAVYISEGNGDSYTGYKDIKERLDYIRSQWESGDVKTFMATLTNENGEDDLEYKAGKRCVIESYDKGETYDRILFLDVNEDGKVERFVVSNNSKYTFKIDERPEYTEPDDEDEDDLRELLADFSTEEGKERIRNRMHLNHLRTLCDCYSTGDFAPLFFFLSDDVVLESQWVMQPNVGRKAVEDYFTGKGKTLKKHNCCPECRIVRLVGNLNSVESDVSVNGKEPEHAKVGLLYSDGKLCMYMSQTLNGETNGVIVDVTMDDRNMISRIDLCMPELFRFEPYEEDPAEEST